MKKDCKIELYRFLAAIFIIMGHYKSFYGNVIRSGYLLY